MASIYKRGRIWWIHYLIGGKSVSRSLKTTVHRVAVEKKKHLEALEVIGQLGTPSNISIGPFLQSFCEFLKTTRPHKSAKNDISYLRSFFGPCCPAMELGSRVPRKFRRQGQMLPKVRDKLRDIHVPISRLEQISPEMISNFIRDRIINDNIAPKTANRQREVLHRMFSYAIEQFRYVCPDRRYRNPAKGTKRIKESAPVITWLTLEEVENQLSVLQPDSVIFAMVATYIYAGLRREEAIWLTGKDVDLKDRLIRIQAKTVDKRYWQPKTKRNRVVPISDALFDVLSTYRQSSHCIWFFPLPNGKGTRWNPDYFSEKLRKINSANSLDWSCLDFRHTFGSHLAQKGESLYKISALMGNSPEICRKHYAALIPEEMSAVVEFGQQSKVNNGDGESKKMLEQIIRKLDKTDGSVEKRPRLRLVKPTYSA